MALTYVGSDSKSSKSTPNAAKAQFQRRASRGHALRSSKRGSVRPGTSTQAPTPSGPPPSSGHHHGGGSHRAPSHTHAPAAPPPRSSVRSKASTGSSSSQTRAKSLKSCCRTFVEFMFTQVGVGALVVAYTLMGASIFQHIETQVEDASLIRVENYLNETVRQMWTLTNRYNVLNKDLWTSDINAALQVHEQKLVYFVQEEGYDQQTNEQRWTFPSALMFALSIITMIGYGDLVPRTEGGKIAAIVYACFGIPVYILYFMNMGKRANYDPMSNAGEDVELDEAYFDELEQQVIVPSTTCLYVMSFYLLVGTIMFAEWEGWNYLDSIYFCVTSLLKIGFGDFVPGAVFIHDKTTKNDHVDTQIKLVMNFVYILVGMGIVAMCYYLLKEEVNVRMEHFKTKMRQKVARLRAKLVT
eukprot:maker-scaffold153_size302544-snap-gene-1.7 protein:Tk03371 transcript:maker-scaffold153_size302544-snap-gene-1.7-mRNA-1 annotation:"hypothetical protein DAPPUDRAFT_324055"